MALKGNTKKEKEVKVTVGPLLPFGPQMLRTRQGVRSERVYMLHMRWPYRGLETACKRGYWLTMGSKGQPEKERWGSLSGKSLPNISQWYHELNRKKVWRQMLGPAELRHPQQQSVCRVCVCQWPWSYPGLHRGRRNEPLSRIKCYECNTCNDETDTGHFFMLL